MADAPSLSKHAQTVLVSLATGAIGWMAFSLQNNNIQLAVLAEKVERLEHRAYASPAIDIRQDPPTPALPTIPGYPALPVSMPESIRRR